jgi:hypothetical protein
MTRPIDTNSIAPEYARYLVTLTGDVKRAFAVEGLEGVTVAYRHFVLGEPYNDDPPYSQEWNRAREEIFDGDNWSGDFFTYLETFEDGSFSAQRITHEQ